jgi:hypothetical protein
MKMKSDENFDFQLQALPPENFVISAVCKLFDDWQRLSFGIDYWYLLGMTMAKSIANRRLVFSKDSLVTKVSIPGVYFMTLFQDEISIFKFATTVSLYDRV